MRISLFLARVAFICNLFFLLALLLRLASWGADPVVVSIIGIIGYFLVLLLNPLVNLIYFVLFIRRKLFPRHPRWLVLANFIFLLLQLQHLLFLNDKLYTQ